MPEVIECEFAEAPEISDKAMHRKDNSRRWRPLGASGKGANAAGVGDRWRFPGRGCKPAGFGDRWRLQHKLVHGWNSAHFWRACQCKVLLATVGAQDSRAPPDEVLVMFIISKQAKSNRGLERAPRIEHCSI